MEKIKNASLTKKKSYKRLPNNLTDHELGTSDGSCHTGCKNKIHNASFACDDYGGSFSVSKEYSL